MTTRQLKDSNWASVRKSIISKYNKNGDGNFDQSEVDGIIDDYMGTIYNQQSLQDLTKSQKRTILFGAIMIVLLALSNLGTGIAAAYIAKDVKVVDGRMTGVEDEEGSATTRALMTERYVRSFEVKALPSTTTSRRMQEPIETDETDEENEDDDYGEVTIACISEERVKAIVEAVQMSGIAHIEVQRFDSDVSIESESVSQRPLPRSTDYLSLAGSMRATRMTREDTIERRLGDENSVPVEQFLYEFSDSNVSFYPNHPNCQVPAEDQGERRLWSFLGWLCVTCTYGMEVSPGAVLVNLFK